MRNRDYRNHKKLNGGPGGWRCSCCNPYCTEPRKMKHLAHRLVRRTSKHRLNNEFRKIEEDQNTSGRLKRVTDNDAEMSSSGSEVS